MAKAVRVCSKAGNCSRLGIALQVRGAKNCASIEPLRRFYDKKPGWRQRQGANLLADALDPAMAAVDEKRHVGAERQADAGQLRLREVQRPQSVERDQRGRRVGRSVNSGLLR